MHEGQKGTTFLAALVRNRILINFGYFGLKLGVGFVL